MNYQLITYTINGAVVTSLNKGEFQDWYATVITGSDNAVLHSYCNIDEIEHSRLSATGIVSFDHSGISSDEIPEYAKGLIDWNVVSKFGLLERINSEILHPMGLAICLNSNGVSEGVLVSIDGVFEYPEDNSDRPKLTDEEIKSNIDDMFDDF